MAAVGNIWRRKINPRNPHAGSRALHYVYGNDLQGISYTTILSAMPRSAACF